MCLKYLAVDVNGTLTLDGQFLPGVSERLEILREKLDICLNSADTHGTLAARALLGMTTFGTLFSIYLTFLEPLVIGATCAWCLSSANINTLQL
jgi:hypothetical protein